MIDRLVCFESLQSSFIRIQRTGILSLRMKKQNHKSNEYHRRSTSTKPEEIQNRFDSNIRCVLFELSNVTDRLVPMVLVFALCL